MARKEIIFTLQDAERTLKFKARQMPATKLEMFIIKLAAVALHGGIANSFNGLPEGKGISEINWRDVNIDEVFKSLGNVNVEEVAELGNELLKCCSLITSDGVEQELMPETIDAVIEEVGSLWTLKKKAFEVNFSSFLKGGKSNETPDLSPSSSGIQTVNVTPSVANVVAARLATLHELQTIYSYDDLLDMCEILANKNTNDFLLADYMRKNTKGG